MDSIHRHIQSARDLLNSSGLSGIISRNAVGSLFIRIGSLISAFVLNVILARFMGVNEYGNYVFALGWLNVLVIPAMLGFDKLLVREMAIYQIREDWGALNGVFYFAVYCALPMSLFVGLLLSVVIHLISAAQPGAALFYLVALLLPILTMLRIQQSAMQGLNHSAIGQLPELVILPIIQLLFAYAAFKATESALPASRIMNLYLGAGSVAVFAGFFLVRHVFVTNIPAVQPVFNRNQWIPVLFPMMVIGGIYILNDQLAAILLGLLADSREVAIFSAAERWGRFIVFGLFSLNPVLAPVFAKLHTHQDWGQLQKVVTGSAQAAALFALVPLLAYIIAPGFFLSVFGDEFSAGKTLLVIIGVGQFVNASAGSVGMLLSMTGYERIVVYGAGFGVLVNLLIGLLLIPELHAAGAAIAASSSMIATNMILSVFVFRRLGIAPTALGWMLTRRKQNPGMHGS